MPLLVDAITHRALCHSFVDAITHHASPTAHTSRTLRAHIAPRLAGVAAAQFSRTQASPCSLQKAPQKAPKSPLSSSRKRYPVSIRGPVDYRRTKLPLHDSLPWTHMSRRTGPIRSKLGLGRRSCAGMVHGDLGTGSQARMLECPERSNALNAPNAPNAQNARMPECPGLL